MTTVRVAGNLLTVVGPPVVAGVGLALGFAASEKNTHWVLAFVSIVAYGVPPLISGWFSPNLSRLILFPPIAIVSLAVAWIIAGPLSDDSTIVITVYVGVLFGGFASILFLAGWALHWYFRRVGS